MSDLVVFRCVNFLYYVIFFTYALLTFIFLFPKRKEDPFRNAYRVFFATSIVLIAMEVFGTFSGTFFGRPIRVFYIEGENIIAIQIILQIIMGFGEGGASTAIMYLMVESIYNKKYSTYFLYLSILTIIMLIFTSFTFLYQAS